MTIEALQPKELPPVPIRKLVGQYLSSQEFNARIGNPNTRYAYRADLKDFAQFLETQAISFQNDVSPQLVLDWIRDMEERLSRSTVARRTACVRGFFRWGITEGYFPNGLTDTLPVLRIKREPPKVLTPEETARLVFKSREKSLRDATIVQLLLKTGITPPEIGKLKTQDIIEEPDKKSVSLMIVKDEEKIKIGLDQETQEILRRYILQRKTLPGNALFFNLRDQKYKGNNGLTRAGIWLIIKALGKEIGEDWLSPTTVRHTGRALGYWKRRPPTFKST